MTLNNQQPAVLQIAYVEADNLKSFVPLQKDCSLMKDVDLLGATALDEQSEITTQTLMQFYESLIPDTPAKTKIYEGPKKNWRLFVTTSPQLETSPLYKTLWIKPCPSDWNILAPYRAYLQTCGLAASPENFPVLARNLFSAGITRIRPLGQMTEDHVGEPHDGEYGLLRFLRRVSMQSEFFYAPSRGLTTPITLVPLMDKRPFKSANQRDIHTDLYFKSGGSSGTPHSPAFYRDYHLPHVFRAKGLIAAPQSKRFYV